MYNLNEDLFETIFSSFLGIQDNGHISHDKESNEYTVKIKAPGWKKDEINVEVDYEKMFVSTNLETDDERKQFGVNGFKYAINVKNIDSKSVNAKLEDGILTIIFSIDKKTLPKKINIT